MKRLTFLTHFALCLTVVVGVVFAGRLGLLTKIWVTDESHMTQVIALAAVIAMIVLGKNAWRVDSIERFLVEEEPSAAFGHLAEKLAVTMAVAGTAYGLFNASTATDGAVSFTALVTTGVGAATASVMAVLTYNLEQGIERARR